MAKIFSRPFPSSVAGRVASFSCDPALQTFTLAFEPSSSSSSSISRTVLSCAESDECGWPGVWSALIKADGHALNEDAGAHWTKRSKGSRGGQEVVIELDERWFGKTVEVEMAMALL